MGLLIQNAQLNGEATDVLIEGSRFSKIEPHIECTSEKTLDATGMAIMPSFTNMHTHASMTLLRSYADDLELHDWLTNYIWPLEAKLNGGRHLPRCAFGLPGNGQIGHDLLQ